MNEEGDSRKSNSNPLTTTLLILILLVALALLCELTALLYDRRSDGGAKAPTNDEVSIPIPAQAEDAIDYGTPEINGKPIAVPAAEADRIQPDSSKTKAEFQAGIERLRKKGDEKAAATLSKRDEFARRRLQLLKAIEKAETPMERKKLIEKFK
ncbi:MAG: hypothetical protein GXP32_06765 [Kiritimatiellaeota bacterium]|nr:hypothetical protein [Kiritimatiellota bacterium]